MAKSPRRQTFADLVREPTWSEIEAPRTERNAPRPGRFNAVGEFFDPEGQRLLLQKEDVSVEEAQRLVDAGARVVAEGCGCGGWFGDCTPEWLTGEHLGRLRGGPTPRFTGRHGAPTWIDVWTNEGGAAVFAHGDVSWGGAALG